MAEEFARLPPGTMTWSGGCQLNCSKKFEGSSLLSFNAIRVDRVQQIYRHALDNFIEHANASVEIRLELAGDRSVVERLRELSPGNLAVGDEHQAVKASACRVRCHGCRGIPGRCTRNPVITSLPRKGRGYRHACVFERACGVHTLVFSIKLLYAGRLSAVDQFVNGRIAFADGNDLFGCNFRKYFSKAPNAALVRWFERSPSL